MWYKIKKIYQWTNLVRPEPPFKPWANTLAYYPLESNGNDYSWNWHNLTWNSTPIYWTSWWTKNVANLTANNVWRISSLWWDYTNYTLNVWCKPTWTSDQWQLIFSNFYTPTSWQDATNQVYFYFNWHSDYISWKKDFVYQYRPNWWTTAYQTVSSSTNREKNARYNVCVASTSSWVKLYLNWTQIASNSTTWRMILNSWYNTIWWRYDSRRNRYDGFLWWYLSEFILENKTWTATEISDYYNQTKSLYWL